MNRVAFYTLGCKVNQYETDAMSELFAKRGYELVDFHETADIYIQKCTREYKDRYAITVVSSDHLIQVAALGDGARRMSSRTMLKRIEELKKGQKSIQKTSHKPFKDLFAAAKIDTDEKE